MKFSKFLFFILFLFAPFASFGIDNLNEVSGLMVKCAVMMNEATEEATEEAKNTCESMNGCKWENNDCQVGCEQNVGEGFVFKGGFLKQNDDNDCLKEDVLPVVYDCITDTKTAVFRWRIKEDRKIDKDKIKDICSVYEEDAEFFVKKYVFTKCKAGEYLVDDQTCKSCEDGYYCQNLMRYSCPAGYYCKNGNITRCPAGSVSAEKQAECTECGVGKRANDNQSACESCPIGTKGVKDNTNASVCKTCDEGTYTDKEGQTECKTCEAGYFCPGEEWSKKNIKNYGSLDSWSGCTEYCLEKGANDAPVYSTGVKYSCPIGFYTNSTGQSYCEPCASNKTNTRFHSTTCDKTVFDNLSFKSNNNSIIFKWPTVVTIDNHLYNYCVAGDANCW